MWLRFRRLCLVVPTHQLSEVGKEVEKALRNGGNVRRKLRQSRAPQLVTVSHDVTDCRMKPAETWLGRKKVQRELKPHSHGTDKNSSSLKHFKKCCTNLKQVFVPNGNPSPNTIAKLEAKVTVQNNC